MGLSDPYSRTDARRSADRGYDVRVVRRAGREEAQRARRRGRQRELRDGDRGGRVRPRCRRPAGSARRGRAGGYHASLPEPGASAAAHDAAAGSGPAAPRSPRSLAALSVPVVVLSMVEPLQFDYWQWLALALATPVVLWGGWPFHRAALVNLRHGAATMDTLISVGTLAAWGWSVVALLFLGSGGPDMRMELDLSFSARGVAENVYFEVACAVTVLILLGRYLETRAKRRAGAAWRSSRSARKRRASRTATVRRSCRSRSCGREMVRGAPGREDRHRRPRRGGRIGGRRVDADR